MPKKIVGKLRRRVVKSFMDILVLAELRKGPLSGYDMIGRIDKRFGILISPGTVYSLMYSMEREGLIEGVWNQQKRVYVLTEEGKRNTEVITKANEEIQSFIRNMSSLDAIQRSPTAT